jgi:ubiquinone/menaquinone biosynthesis C-methylase UbiE
LKQHLDHTAEGYAAARQLSYANRTYYDFWSEVLLDKVAKSEKPIHVLDCMSGSCELTRVADGRCIKLHAADIALGILQKAESDTLPASRACADAHHLPYVTNAFDAAIIRGGLHHIPDSYPRVLEELHRVVKPQGWLVCAEPIDDNPLIKLTRDILHRLSPAFDPNEQGLHESELIEAFQQAGFRDISTEPFGYVGYTLIGNTDVFPVLRKLRLKAFIRFLIWIDRVSPHIPLWRGLGLTRTICARAD